MVSTGRIASPTQSNSVDEPMTLRRLWSAVQASTLASPGRSVLVLVVFVSLLGWSIVVRLKGPSWQAAFGVLDAALVAMLGLRFALRDPNAVLPPSPRWLIAGCGLAVFEAGLDAFPGREETGLAARLLVVAVLIAVIVPVLTDVVVKLLGRLPLIRELPRVLRDAPALYVGFILAASGFLAMEKSDKALEYLAAAGFAVWCIGFRWTLWRRDRRVWIRWLPHAGFWIVFAGSALSGSDDSVDDVFVPVALALVSAMPLGGGYWLVQRAKRRVVQPITQFGVVYGSLQGTAHSYRDVHGHAERLVEAIQRGEAGVFGITGLRGAGKSSLSRKVLDDLRSRFFTLEVTSPARHDPDLGFFIGMCRAVAQRVRDDLRPSFESQPGISRIIARDLLGAAVIGLAGIAVVSWYLSLPPGSWPRNSADAIVSRESLNPFRAMSQSNSPADWERAICLDLQARIDSVLADPTPSPQAINDSWRFTIVPAASTYIGDMTGPGFIVVPVPPDAELEPTLAEDLVSKSTSSSIVVGTPAGYDALLRSTPQWFTGFVAGYGRALRKLTLPAGSLCRPGLVVSWMLRCAALEKAGLELSYLMMDHDGGATRRAEVKTPIDPSSLMFSRDQLRLIAQLLGLYARTLGADAPPSSVTSANETTKALHLPDFDTKTPPAWVFWASISALALLVIFTLTWSRAARLVRAIVNSHDLLLFQEAAAFLEELSYSSSQAANRGFSWRGLSLGTSRTLADRAMTLPGLTARYQSFVERVRAHYNDKLVIVIDELDKVHDSNHVQALLSEIKGALFVQGTYYIISIAEDAAASFRQRLASGRDIFESTFDQILEVPQMDLTNAEAMLRARLPELEVLTPPLLSETLNVATVMAGGIPREILRNARALERLRPADAVAACQLLIVHELDEWIAHLGESKLNGTEVIEVRRAAIDARDALNKSDYLTAHSRLDRCLTVIDRDNVRAVARNIELIAEDQSELLMKTRIYAALSNDIQSCLRLQLLICIGRLVQLGIATCDFAKAVLECHAALHRKPALAETLLARLRATYPIEGNDNSHAIERTQEQIKSLALEAQGERPLNETG